MGGPPLTAGLHPSSAAPTAQLKLLPHSASGEQLPGLGPLGTHSGMRLIVSKRPGLGLCGKHRSGFEVSSQGNQ